MEIVEQNECGFVIPIRDTNAIVEKLNIIAENKKLQDKFSENAIKFSNFYTWENYVEKLDTLVESFLQKKQL